MKYKSVSALCEGVAGAIREKEGSTALINPQDFVDRIKGLEGGGASGSKWRYFKKLHNLPSAGGGDVSIYSAMSQIARYEVAEYNDNDALERVEVSIETGSMRQFYNNWSPIAFGIDPNTKVTTWAEIPEITTLGETLAEYFEDPNYFEEITEEQFYDLNTLLSE